MTRAGGRGGWLVRVAAIAAFGLVVPVWVAGATAGTLGHDFLAYHLAARRLIDGQPLYDQAYSAAGPFGLFLYLPPFAVLMLPLGLLDAPTATLVFAVLSVAAFALAIAILPVDRDLRWLVLLIGLVSWPYLYDIKLGQVGPILLLVFAAGWRWLDRPRRLGGSIALGIVLKIQPAALLGWAGWTGRWRALGWALGVFGVVALLATAVTGLDAWPTGISLLSRVSQPLGISGNVTPGRVALGLGLDAGAAWIVQWTCWIAVAGLVLVALVRGNAVGSYMAVVLGSQLLSPIVWDHYALMLLLPAAWLAASGRVWALLLPLATCLPLALVAPPIVYPLTMAIGLVAVVVEAVRQRSAAELAAAGSAPSASPVVGPASAGRTA